MRPLYITASQGTRISAQGPALRVETPDRAPAVMALRHLSQVVCPATTRWSSKALTQCMNAGVPIVFTGPDGRVMGFLHGLGMPSRGNLFARLIELLGQHRGLRTYQTWFKAMESRQRFRLCRQLRIPADRHRCRTLKRVCRRERQRRASPELVRMLETSWHQALAPVCQHLSQQHLIGFICNIQGAYGVNRCLIPTKLSPTRALRSVHDAASA